MNVLPDSGNAYREPRHATRHRACFGGPALDLSTVTSVQKRRQHLRATLVRFHPVTGSGAAQSCGRFPPPRRAPAGALALALRLCPNASIPSDVVSRCTESGQGSRTSRATNTMSRGSECMDTPEVKAGNQKQEGPEPCGSGPAASAVREGSPTRCPLPDSFDPRPCARTTAQPHSARR
jgi:hypothetical protein